LTGSGLAAGTDENRSSRSASGIRRGLFGTVFVPGGLTAVCTGLWLGLGFSPIVVVAEFFSAKLGIGHIIWASDSALAICETPISPTVTGLLGWWGLSFGPVARNPDTAG
jgi:ABC-type nitrate/sulfonate/bicarbonate transport system permease component